MNMIKKRVSELEGAQLDAAVAIAAGERVRANGDGTYNIRGNSMVPWYSVPRYSVDWHNGGPIIERERMSLGEHDGGWGAGCTTADHRLVAFGSGPTPMIAAMRAFVASKLGDVVEVPE